MDPGRTPARAEHSDRIDVAAPADAIFAFISDIGNLPKCLPTVHGAHAHGADPVEVDGTANGHQYASTGWFKSDPATRLMSWGSDDENDYAGKMTVQGDEQTSQVECALRFSPKTEIKDAMDRHQGGPNARHDRRAVRRARQHQAAPRGYRRKDSQLGRVAQFPQSRPG